MPRSRKKLSYSVVLPTYKECPNLKRLLPQLGKFFSGRGKPFEIIIVDDNSRDGTKELIRNLKAEYSSLRLITRKKVRGLASALVRGTKAAKFPHIIHMDSDLAHQVKDLRRLVRHYEQHLEPVMVVGSRFIEGSAYTGKPKLNQLASLVGRFISRWFFRLKVLDTSNNFRIFPAKIWLKTLKHLTINGNALLIQELILFQKYGAKILEIPITYKERRLGHSKLNIWLEAKRFFKAFPKLLHNAYFTKT